MVITRARPGKEVTQYCLRAMSLRPFWGLMVTKEVAFSWLAPHLHARTVWIGVHSQSTTRVAPFIEAVGRLLPGGMLLLCDLVPSELGRFMRSRWQTAVRFGG